MKVRQILNEKLNYPQVIVKLPQYKEGIDTILILEGREEGYSDGVNLKEGCIPINTLSSIS